MVKAPSAGPPKATNRSLEGHPLITSRPPNDFRLIQQILPRFHYSALSHNIGNSFGESGNSLTKGEIAPVRDFAILAPST